jgi:hypothetical protein
MRDAMTRHLGLALLAAAVVAGGAAAASGDPEKRDIRPADQAWATHATLTARDVPSSFTANRAPSSKNNGPLTCPGFQPDLSDLTITGEALSPLFQNQAGTTIFASAEVYRSSHDEREAWRRTARREALRCVARMLESISASGLRVTVTRRLVRAAPSVGERAISFRIVATVKTQGISIPVWIDLLGVARGRADATLVISTVRAAPSAALERTLLGKLDLRLKR